jgi:hypothetical protein
MDLELRLERVSEKHIEPYALLSRAEYGDDTAVSQARHLRWKFIENPQGPSIGIHLYRGGELVARMVALTRQFFHRGTCYKAAHIVDFLVHPRERGMNSLLQLVVGLKQLSGFDFLLIMAPNAAGAAVWEKFVKMHGYFDLDVALAPLRPATALQKSGNFRSGPIAPIADWSWRLLIGAATWLRSGWGHTKIETNWPEALELERMFSAEWGDRVIGLRSPEFLEWRYRRSPVFQYDVRFIRENGTLCGYFVTRRAVYDGMDCLFIVDAFGQPQLAESSWRTASRASISQASRCGAEMATILGNTGWGPLRATKTMPFFSVPPRYLPRKTTVYAQWLTQPGFEIRRDNFYVALGDSDVI